MGKGALALALAGAIVITWGYNREKENKDYQEIVSRSGMQRYKPPPPSVIEEKQPTSGPPKRSTLRSVRKVEVGPFLVQAEQRQSTCTVKLYENLPDWQQKLRGTWSGDLGACDGKVSQVVGNIEAVRQERKRPGAGSYVRPETPPVPEELFSVAINGVVQNRKPLTLSQARETAKGISTGVKDQVDILSQDAVAIEAYQRGNRIDKS